jgi:23S rRNA (uracil1939-C5)-methyltransferase
MGMKSSKDIVEATVIGLATSGSQVVVVTKAEKSELVGMRGFLTGTIPGELVIAEVQKRHKRHLELSLTKLVEASSQRIAPPCPVFGLCGGCDLQHIPIENQRNYKLEMVQSMLSRHGKVVPTDGVQSYQADSLPEYSYRNRVTLHRAKNGSFGFRARASHVVVPVKDCLIAEPAIQEVIRALCKFPQDLTENITAIRLEVTVSSSVTLLAQCSTPLPTQLAERFVATCLKTLKVRSVRFEGEGDSELAAEEPFLELSQVGHFSQVNSRGNQALKELVGNLAFASPVLELYAGSGNFSFLLAEKGCSVKAVELDSALTQLGSINARKLDLPVEFVCSSAEDLCEAFPAEPLLLLDPPRAGAFEALKRLDLSRCEQIVYVSCDLASFSRDLSLLQERGFYCKNVFVVDMFPQTSHVECVANLYRKH